MPKMFQVIPTTAEDQEGVPHPEARAARRFVLTCILWCELEQSKK